jgi:hypothetical protein
LQQAALKSEAEKAPQKKPGIGKPRTVAGDVRPGKTTECAPDSFSCEWPRLSEGINDLKKLLFGSSPGRPKRSG